MNRPWNFSAGPSALPVEVLQQAAAEMLNWHSGGMSVMEMSHRGADFGQIRDAAESDLRTLLAIPDDFHVLFMQGGATAQNAILPMNLLGENNKADYVLTGNWSKKSYNEAKRYGDISIAAAADQATTVAGREYQPWTWVPAFDDWQVRSDAKYLHICANETVGGIEFAQLPDLTGWGLSNRSLVADMSSNILSRSIDFDNIGMVYAGAQKNAGPAGVTLVIVHDSLIGPAQSHCPTVFDYNNVITAKSMFNTPPTYAIYMAGLVFKWLLQNGGVGAMDAASAAKSQALYNYIDGSDFYVNNIEPSCRSRMNVPFQLHNDELNQTFLAESAESGLLALKGHKSVGGMRASLYNAIPLQAVQALIEFMRDFEVRYG